MAWLGDMGSAVFLLSLLWAAAFLPWLLFLIHHA